MSSTSICLVLLAAIEVLGCSTQIAVKDERPISERGLTRIDLQNKVDIQKLVISAILHNPNVAEQSRFATACYKDLFLEKGARTSAKINPTAIDTDIALMVRRRQQSTYESFLSKKYWVRATVEGKTSTLTSPNDPLTTFDTFVEMPPHESLRDFSDINPVERRWKAGTLAARSALPMAQQQQLLVRFGPLVSGEATNPFGECYVVFDIPKLHIVTPVNRSEYQQHIYESAKAGDSLKFTADVDIEYSFAGCRLGNCSPRITDQQLRNFKFGWAPR